MSKLVISKFVSKSRLIEQFPGKMYQVSETQSIDFIVKGCEMKVVFLPIEYHSRFPIYIREKLREIGKMDKLMVLVLAENEDEVGRVHEVQMECLRYDVNMMLCFTVRECKQVLEDLISC